MCRKIIIPIVSSLLGLNGCHSIQKETSTDARTPWMPTCNTIPHHDFLSPQKTLVGKYSLLELIEIGLKFNPQTKHAWWHAKEAFANQGRAEASLFPHADVSANINREQVGKNASQPTQRTDNWGPAVTLTYKVFQFGTDAAAAQSAAHLLHAANYAFNRQLQTTVFEIQRAFYNFFSAYAKIEAHESCLQDATLSFEAVSQRKENGLARVQDVLLAKADKLQAEYELQAAKADLESCRATLATTVGVPIAADFSIETDYLSTETQKPFRNIENLMREVLDKRADLLANEATLEAKKWSQKATHRGFLPSLSLHTQTSALKHKHNSHWQRNYGLSVGIQWNIFSGFDSQYSELASYTQWKEQKYTLRQQKLEALRQTWTAFHAFQSSVQLSEASKALEEAAQEALNAIRTGYNTGINSLLDLLAAQKTLANARLKHIQAKTDVKLNLVQLAYITGQLDIKTPTQFNL
ncbi:MAG: TolC family protein [Puniceicoccales bacterium]|jgi:outer membrane protein TolC|nr:TolC family protein [Puniceicoccales bacterium]